MNTNDFATATPINQRISRSHVRLALLLAIIASLMAPLALSNQASAASKTPFSLLMSKTSVTVNRGTEVLITLTAVRANGFTAPIYLGTRTLPTGIRALVAENPMLGKTTTLRIVASSTAALKRSTITITGSSKGRTSNRSLTVSVSNLAPLPTIPQATMPPATLPPVTTIPVTAPPTVTLPPTTKAPAVLADYSLTVEPATLTLPLNTATRATVKIARTGGFADALLLETKGLPAGVSAFFTPNPVGANEAIVTFNATTALAAPVDVVVLARGRETKIRLSTTTAASTAAVTATPATLTVAPGTAQGVALSLNRPSSATTPVSWTASGVPNGTTATFSQNNTAFSTTTATFAVSSLTAVGTYPVIITSVADGVANSVAVTLTVGTSGSNVSPAALTVSVGTVGTTLFTPAGINFGNTIAFSTTGLPVGVNPIFNVASNGITIQLPVTTASPNGVYPITFTASQNGVTVSGVLTLTITGSATNATTTTTTTTTANQYFQISAQQSGLSIGKGASAVLTILTSFSNGTAPTALNYVASGGPAQTQFSYSAQNVPGGTTVNIAIPAGTTAGTYSVTVTASATISGAVRTSTVAVPVTVF